ncbi:LapA family protein [Deefgea salmonis]|uniref:LapA family protein n=1 Tax=Deefgea salmonis TaxID=2875502 RepID=A0ABS8BH46_9NEIS|nr:LapA family protein [Deefgea salmonis]MCB5195028.1 LapA family protein [Deefgea salmonis]
MRYLLWAVKFTAFVMLFGFAMHNANPVTLNFFFNYVWHAPLALILLVFFVSGAVIGLLASLGQVIRLRRELVAIRKEKRQPINSSTVLSPSVAIEPPRDAL